MREGVIDLITAGKELNEVINNLDSVPEGLENERYRIVAESMVVTCAERVSAALIIFQAVAEDDKTVEVDVYVDGACSGNPGPGGWGFKIEKGEMFAEGSGADPNTTNNKMEITAAIKGIEAIKELGPKLKFRASRINVYSDSEYLINTMKGLFKRKANHLWWEELDKMADGLTIEWFHIPGHAGHEQNERADFLAKEAIIHMLAKREGSGPFFSHMKGGK